MAIPAPNRRVVHGFFLFLALVIAAAGLYDVRLYRLAPDAIYTISWSMMLWGHDNPIGVFVLGHITGAVLWGLVVHFWAGQPTPRAWAKFKVTESENVRLTDDIAYLTAWRERATQVMHEKGLNGITFDYKGGKHLAMFLMDDSDGDDCCLVGPPSPQSEIIDNETIEADDPTIPDAPCAAFGVYDDLTHETAEQADRRIERVWDALRPIRDDQPVYVLHAGGRYDGLGFGSLPRRFNELALLDGKKILWATQAENWEAALVKYHEFMGWEPYRPMGYDLKENVK